MATFPSPQPLEASPPNFHSFSFSSSELSNVLSAMGGAIDKCTECEEFQRNIWMFPKIVGFPSKSSILIGVFHYKPSILGYPYFSKHPSPVFVFFVESSQVGTSLSAVFGLQSSKKKALSLQPKQGVIWVPGIQGTFLFFGGFEQTNTCHVRCIVRRPFESIWQ